MAPSWISQPSPITVPAWTTTCAPKRTSVADPHAVAEQQAGPRSDGRMLHPAGGVERVLHPGEHAHDAQAGAPVGDRRRGPRGCTSTKCSHSIRSGSRFGIAGLWMSPERVMYSPHEPAGWSKPLSKIVTLRSRSMSSNVAIRREPTTVKRRSLCGSSHERCRCAARPDGKRRKPKTTSSMPWRM